jgi:transposase-like protein
MKNLKRLKKLKILPIRDKNLKNPKMEAKMLIQKEKRDKETNGTGFKSEKIIYNILLTLLTVAYVQKDWSNSRFDYFFLLHGETLARGLQVKTLKLIPGTENDYNISSCGKYPNGTLIVAADAIRRKGLVFFTLDENGGPINLRSKPIYKFTQRLLEWDEFLVTLEDCLKRATVITAEVFTASMNKSNLDEYCCLKRLEYFCHRIGYTFEKVLDNSSVTDVIINGKRCQVKFVTSDETGGYPISLRKGCKLTPYEKGDNDMYIVEVAEFLGTFIFMTEQQLIESGQIKTETQPGATCFKIFPYNYLNQKKILKGRSKCNKRRGNWTMNKDLWVSTEHGNIGMYYRYCEYHNITPLQ